MRTSSAPLVYCPPLPRASTWIQEGQGARCGIEGEDAQHLACWGSAGDDSWRVWRGQFLAGTR